jgi:Fe-S oxidoreductase
VLNCCAKPSHDLGRQKFFHSSFDELKRYFLSHGVKKILVACPSCFKVFQQYGEGWEIDFVYEYLAGHSSVEFANHSMEVKIHDPCSSRTEKHLHATIRKLVLEKSISVAEFENQGVKTLCCGEGGAVCHVNKELAGNWGKSKRKEAEGSLIITYCAGCAHFLNTVNPTSHILDLYFQPDETLKGKNKVSRNPWTYFNRLLLKRYFQKNIDSESR